MSYAPVIFIKGKNLAEVWEKSIIELWNKGIEIKTEYNEMSKDCTMIMEIEEPFSEPRIHKAGIIGSYKTLIEYVNEILEGIHDKYVEEGKWPYTYHERLFNYKFGENTINQIDYILEKLKETPYTRRAQAITWKPWNDTKIDDPPCLQRIWLRVFQNRLVMHTTWRSRDALKAAFMNMYALTELQKRIANELNVEIGKYVDISNSYHIYERDYETMKKIIKTFYKRSWNERTLTTEKLKKYITGRVQLPTIV